METLMLRGLFGQIRSSGVKKKEAPGGGSERTREDSEARGWESGGVEGTVSWGLAAPLPVCVNQQAAHGCNEVENKKNIKMSKWNKREGEIFYDEPKFSLVCSRSLVCSACLLQTPSIIPVSAYRHRLLKLPPTFVTCVCNECPQFTCMVC